MYHVETTTTRESLARFTSHEAASDYMRKLEREGTYGIQLNRCQCEACSIHYPDCCSTYDGCTSDCHESCQGNHECYIPWGYDYCPACESGARAHSPRQWQDGIED